MKSSLSIYDLSVAEFYILMFAPKVRFTQLMMLTLKDLSLRNVIDLRVEKPTWGDERHRNRTQIMVYPYSDFDTETVKAHERIFINAIDQKEKISLYNYLRFVYEQIHTEHSYVRDIRLSQLAPYFKKYSWSLFKLTPKLNKKGMKLRTQMLHEVYRETNHLIDLLKSSPKKAYELTDQLSARLYMLNKDKKNEINDVLMNENSSVLKSAYKEVIYGWYLEWENLQEYDGYFLKSMQLSNYRN